MKLTKQNSTKAERRFAERLNRARIPFQTKVHIGGREVDFLIGRYAIEINGHEQDPIKNVMLVHHGYIPVHISNNLVNNVNIKVYE